MISVAITLHFAKGYIGHPYWVERSKLIDIQKASGLNRVRSEDKRAKALKAFLDTHDMTMDDYRALEVAANRPFYTDAAGLIVISAHQLHGLMGQADDNAPSSIRLARPEQIRTLIEWEDLATGKTKPDGIFERFVPVKSGTGQMLSNQRGLRADPYIENFSASGAVKILTEEHLVKARQFIEWAGIEIGVGAARKVSYGRFTVTQWEPAVSAAAAGRARAR